MSRGRLSWFGKAVLLAVLPGVLATGCRQPGATAPAAAPALPSSSTGLEVLIVTRVASGLPRLPDDDLNPRAGAKQLDDIAGYSSDPSAQRTVLRGYGYRFGWERFWGAPSGPMTGVFVDQFEAGPGAATYAADLARNEAAHYGGMLQEDPPSLPDGCRLLTVSTAQPKAGLRLPAAFAWCRHGVFSVSVTAMATTVAAAETEVRAVLTAQLGRLPR